ncbi:MAG TPA: hypothetical protein VF540_00265 [Segetibacter sp.]|jgi:PHD/YefM family antitoxin component YafN of YafNO toxin-antitoxin module
MATMVVTNEKGKQVGVLVPLKEYEKMMKALEDALMKEHITKQ